jgi:predicted nucleic acid-binding protein
MEEGVLVDSSYFIRHFRTGIDPFKVLEEADEIYEFFSCGVVKTEVCRGVRTPKLLERTRGLFEVMCWVPTTDQVWDRVLELAWNLGRRGITMQVTDMVIAVSALTVDAAVLTLDSDFDDVPGLRVIHSLD